eukprot:TRINITY_DN71194_c0_g1_i1.p2 TRINITY_DN71194_c0_g1~~TRINITY_DN71194_c0_g1_i1.p2  ORF type:complete len:135 (-),score=12.14 TRINITY_DN71194_c0_g1_i1:47-451(-)
MHIMLSKIASFLLRAKAGTSLTMQTRCLIPVASFVTRSKEKDFDIEKKEGKEPKKSEGCPASGKKKEPCKPEKKGKEEEPDVPPMPERPSTPRQTKPKPKRRHEDPDAPKKQAALHLPLHNQILVRGVIGSHMY